MQTRTTSLRKQPRTKKAGRPKKIGGGAGMKKRLAIVIAVETYADPRIQPVKYAEADAKGFAKALENGGPLDKVFLLSGNATRTTINSKVRQHVKTLTREDELYIFYAGHGFSKNGRNYIMSRAA
jgi:uncharacterized caspase-like protein